MIYVTLKRPDLFLSAAAHAEVAITNMTSHI